MNDEAEESKESLRKALIARVRGLGEQRPDRDQALCDRLQHLPEIEQAESILAFAPLPSEPRIDPVIDEWLHSTHRILLPKVGAMPGDMEPVSLDQPLSELARDGWGIRTPQGRIWNRGIDLILVPGCGFDLNLGRLGRGGGYYDRFLARQSTAITVGVCFECQLIDRLPTESHDRPVDLIVTESRVIGG